MVIFCQYFYSLVLSLSLLPPSLPPSLGAYKYADGKKIDGRRIVVDVERGRTVKSWKPRRLGEGGREGGWKGGRGGRER